MSNYTQSTNFATKDNLSSGDPLKIVKGTEINTEFANIAIAIATKADLASPTFTGTPAAPTATSGTNTTQIATTAYVQTEVGALNGSNISSGTVAVTYGGTGASTASNARTNLGLAIGTDVLAPNGSGASLTSLNASSLSSGTVATARLGSGTANSSTFLRGDGAWASAVPASLGDIGTTIIAAVNTTSFLKPGDTVSGSNVSWPTTVSSTPNDSTWYSEGDNSTLPNTQISPSTSTYITGSNIGYGNIRRSNSGNTGYVAPQGFTAGTGTWRVLTGVSARQTNYDSGGNTTTSVTFMALVLRVS